MGGIIGQPSRACKSGPRRHPCRIMAWFILIIAAAFEIAWAIGLKYTDGFTRPLPSLLTGLAMVASLYGLSLAVRTLPLGTAYAVWVGIGTAGTTILGMLLFDEPRETARLLCLALLIIAVIGLKLTAGE